MEEEAVSGNFFDQMEVQPEPGRPMQAPDDRAGAPPVALISAGLWARAFGSSPLVLGRTVKLNMIPVTIIGVTPQGLPFRSMPARGSSVVDFAPNFVAIPHSPIKLFDTGLGPEIKGNGSPLFDKITGGVLRFQKVP